MERVTTGVTGLDQVLQGGLPTHSLTIIAGGPGTGKSILAQQALFARDPGQTVLHIGTVSEPSIKALRFIQEYSFFDVDKFMSSVVYHDIGSLLATQGAAAALTAIDEAVVQYRPHLVVIDSFRAIADAFSSELALRTAVYNLSVKMPVWESTVLLVGEYTEQEALTRPEFAVADGVVLLYGTQEPLLQARRLRVLKMRGTHVLMGEHAFTISDDGIAVHPRWKPDLRHQQYPASVGPRESTGIAGLDRMLSGGTLAGSTTIVTGPTGSGKSLLTLSWALAAAEQGKRSLLVSYDSPVEFIINNASSVGFDLRPLIEEGLLTVMHISPIDVGLDENLEEIARYAIQEGIKQVAIDSISGFELGISDRLRFFSNLWRTVDWFRAQGASLYLVSEQPLRAPVGHPAPLSFLADCILELGYTDNGDGLGRYIRILKARGTAHDLRPRPLAITSHGLVVTDAS